MHDRWKVYCLLIFIHISNMSHSEVFCIINTVMKIHMEAQHKTKVTRDTFLVTSYLIE